jgi:hypothetical protein
MIKSNRSGGPKTSEGKSIASRNALKSGAYSKAITLPGEDEAEFQEIEDRLAEEFQTSGILEHALIADLASVIWKQIRLQRLEKSHLLNQLDRKPTAAELREVGLNPPSAADHFLNDPPTSDHLKAIAEGRFHVNLQAFLLAPNGVKAVSIIRDSDTMLFEWLLSYAEQAGLLAKTDRMRDMITKDLFVALKNHELTRLAWGMAEAAASVLWVLNNAEAIEEASQKVRDLRLLKFMQLEGAKRAQDDLARAFYRTLSELRKQIEWRQKSSLIDVTPG